MNLVTVLAVHKCTACTMYSVQLHIIEYINLTYLVTSSRVQILFILSTLRTLVCLFCQYIKSPNNEQNAFPDSIPYWNFFVIRDLHFRMSQAIIPTYGLNSKFFKIDFWQFWIPVQQNIYTTLYCSDVRKVTHRAEECRWGDTHTSSTVTPCTCASPICTSVRRRKISYKVNIISDI